MLTYAVDDKMSFKNLKMWQSEFMYYADVKENAHFPFIVVGNKVSVHLFVITVSQLKHYFLVMITDVLISNHKLWCVC